MRVHDLFTHTAGLSYGFDEQSALDEMYRKSLWAKMETHPETTLEEGDPAIAHLPLAYHPGRAFRYSVAIDVLGYIVQVVSGQAVRGLLAGTHLWPAGHARHGVLGAARKSRRAWRRCMARPRAAG